MRSLGITTWIDERAPYLSASASHVVNKNSWTRLDFLSSTSCYIKKSQGSDDDRGMTFLK